ncbi:hypothetical protein F5B22DRAFT_336867 [Xylaria bambusicola]|uniref:uncharacterized protein n=1 Tax=Xylaria bambusicola TaxID=326684 RepID=UPI002008B191|nr:uncharacterized protein F5B22DRAFT_336867 [Xylaria bambusicola]KAI0525392.1 hypothetical protein F5B22DRAFT_336867 [Xylaria bambusicola]
MAAIARQPFAPLNEARLHTLTSLKNRQNAISSPSPVKRKASDVAESDDSENVDPVLFAKRAKGADSFYSSKGSFVKPSTFFLTKSASTNDLPVSNSPKAAAPRSRNVLNPKSPAAKLNISIARSSPLSAPAGRSPTRGKRSGILSSRKNGSSFSRIDPPVFGLSNGSSAAPFSLDAALKGTISSYTSRSDVSTSKKPSSALSDFSGLHEPEMNSSWFFDIHEDTEEQEMTNLLQHSTCVLDISSDEESESRRQRERAEGKENIPPVDDVSQTSRPRAARLAAGDDDMVVEKERNPLGEMDPKQYYAKGCYENSIVIVPGEDDDEPIPNEVNFVPEASTSAPADGEVEAGSVAEPCNLSEENPTAEELMQKTDAPASGAALLEPLEGTGESFEVWESSSAKDETEAAAECS